jgi:hypothetical protein
MEIQTEKKEEPVKIALFKSILNVTFGLIKWKVLGTQHELLISKIHNLISMYVNPNTEVFSLKVPSNRDVITMDAVRVDALVLSKDKLTIIGDFDGSKTSKENNLTLS